MITAVHDERVQQVFKWCVDAFGSSGVILRLPPNTDPKKTYQWRYVASFARRLDEYGFDEQTSRYLLETIADYAKTNRLLQKGLAVLFQANTIKVCLEKLERQQQHQTGVLDDLNLVVEWLAQQSNNKRVQWLLWRNNPDAKPNIVAWHKVGKLSTLFLASSKSCAVAMQQLDQKDRQFLPNDRTLYLIRLRTYKDKRTITTAKQILGPDWRNDVCNDD